MKSLAQYLLIPLFLFMAGSAMAQVVYNSPMKGATFYAMTDTVGMSVTVDTVGAPMPKTIGVPPNSAATTTTQPMKTYVISAKLNDLPVPLQLVPSPMPHCTIFQGQFPGTGAVITIVLIDQM